MSPGVGVGSGDGGTAGAPGYRHFHEQLAALKRRLLEMSDMAESLVEVSVEALLRRDREKADLVITGDRDLDAMELEVEQAAIQLLALQQPMARDLRFLVGRSRSRATWSGSATTP
jgi:phosphate transport system protein